MQNLGMAIPSPSNKYSICYITSFSNQDCKNAAPLNLMKVPIIRLEFNSAIRSQIQTQIQQFASSKQTLTATQFSQLPKSIKFGNTTSSRQETLIIAYQNYQCPPLNKIPNQADRTKAKFSMPSKIQTKRRSAISLPSQTQIRNTKTAKSQIPQW